MTEDSRSERPAGFWPGLLERLGRLAPPGARDPQDEHHWQERILLAVLLLAALGSPLALLGLLPAMLAKQAWLLFTLDLAAWVVVLFILVRPGLSYRFRAACTCLAVFLIALALFNQLGPNMPAPAWLFAFAVLAGLLLGRRAALIAVAMNAATLTVIGLGIERGAWGPGDAANITLETWAESALSFLFVNLLVAMGVSQVVRGLGFSHRRTKQQAAELQAMRNLQKGILDSIAAGIFMVEPETARIAYANSAALRMLGRPESQVVGGDCRALLRDSGADGAAEAGSACLADQAGERILATAAGPDLPVMATATPLTMEGRAYILETFVDISERKELEDQLFSARKLEAVGTLAGGIAHDFNNILAAILGFADLARRDALAGRADVAGMEQIIASAQRAGELVQQILTFSRKRALNLELLDLNQVVRVARDAMARTLPESIVVQISLDEDLPPIQGDADQLGQVLSSLASNAADAMPEGGSLTLETRLVKLDGAYSRRHPEVLPGAYVLLTVSDTGLGMTQDIQQHIFEPFYTTKEVGRGTGLGLSSAFGIVKSHGGHFLCRSQPGQGATFMLYFPVYEGSRPGPVGGRF